MMRRKIGTAALLISHEVKSRGQEIDINAKASKRMTKKKKIKEKNEKSERMKEEIIKR